MKTNLHNDIIFFDRTVSYLLTNQIKSKIFDFDKFIDDIDFKVFLQDNSILSCNCKGSDFIYIITCNLENMKK